MAYVQKLQALFVSHFQALIVLRLSSKHLLDFAPAHAEITACFLQVRGLQDHSVFLSKAS